MPVLRNVPTEHKTISNFKSEIRLDFVNQSNNPNSQSVTDRSGNYRDDILFSNNIQISGTLSEGWIKMDSTNFINLPLNVTGVTQATFIYWGEHFSNDVTLDNRGILTNRSPGNNNRFNLLMTGDTGGGLIPNRIYYDWATSSTAWNSGIVAPHHGPFMFAISINSTGATLSLIDRDSEIKRTYRRSQGHSAISFTQSVLGVSVNSSGSNLYSLQSFWKFYFWTRDFSDQEITETFNLTKDEVVCPRKNAYLIRGSVGTTTDTKAQACLSDKNSTILNYYCNVPYEFIGTGSFLYSNQQLTGTAFGGTFFGFRYTTRYAKINTSTGEILEFGPC